MKKKKCQVMVSLISHRKKRGEGRGDSCALFQNLHHRGRGKGGRKKGSKKK